MFPIKSLSFTAQAPNDASDADEMTEHHLSGAALAEALQYSASAGIPSLLKWLTDFQAYEHGRGTDGGWRISVGTGSQDLLYKVSLYEHCTGEDASTLIASIGLTRSR
jgi:tryptophan aminotransferase